MRALWYFSIYASAASLFSVTPRTKSIVAVSCPAKVTERLRATMGSSTGTDCVGQGRSALHRSWIGGCAPPSDEPGAIGFARDFPMLTT